jgi:hypothetical protein
MKSLHTCAIGRRSNLASSLHSVIALSKSFGTTLVVIRRQEVSISALKVIAICDSDRSPDHLSLYSGVLVMAEYLRSSASFISSSIPSDLPDKLLYQIIEAQRRHKPTIRSGARASFLETGIGVATLVLLSELRRGGNGPFKNEVQSCLELLQSGTLLALKDEGGMPDDGCEVLYGRAGLLYALLLLRLESERAVQSPLSAAVQQETSDDVLQSIVDEVMHRGHTGSAEYRKHYQGSGRTPALMWSWHGRRYLGGAHGVGEEQSPENGGRY